MKEAMCVLTLAVVTAGCSVPSENVLLQEWQTPFKTPPFDEIKSEYFMPAFLAAMEAENAEVEAIAGNGVAVLRALCDLCEICGCGSLFVL